MKIINSIKEKIIVYKYPSLYILLFAVCIMFFNNLALFLISSVILSVALIFINKDAVRSTIAIGHYNSGKQEDAKKIFKSLVDNNTKNATPYAYYGNILLLEENQKEAIEVLEKGMLLKSNPLIHKNLALALSSSYWVNGEVPKAITTLEELKTKYGYLNHNVYATLGYLHLINDNLEKAIENTNLALMDDPKSATALDNMGQIELKRNNIEKSKEYFNEALEIKSNLVDSVYYLGVIEMLDKTKENAISAKKYFEKALECSISVMNTVTKQDIEDRIAECDEIISQN